jgi:putative flavoprotein involved in K+ transport
VTQLVPAEYRNPGALAPGGVLVVGGGQTGVQIAEELALTGRPVYLSVGRSWWAPRRYRGLDMTRWLRLLHWFEQTVDDLPPGARTGRTNPQLTGAGGGHDISAHTLARDGVTVVGRLRDIRTGVASFGDGLAADLAMADQEARAFLHRIDAFVATGELDAPPEAWPADLADEEKASLDLAWARTAPTALDLVAAGVNVVIWATGYHPDLAWVGLPFLAPDGHPIQRRGVTNVPGLFILGLDWQHTAKSGLFAGIDEDATYLAAAMASP